MQDTHLPQREKFRRIFPPTHDGQSLKSGKYRWEQDLTIGEESKMINGGCPFGTTTIIMFQDTTKFRDARI